ncbi:MAG: hypothetical protein IKH57_01775 [Clostridia bacterium]|nr:hypothetical protein [Clostridia bacterium]
MAFRIGKRIRHLLWSNNKNMGKMDNQLAVYAHLALAADDVNHGRVQPAREAFKDILRELRDDQFPCIVFHKEESP